MKHILAIFFCSFLLISAKAQTAADTAALLTLKEMEYDFGKIPQGKVLCSVRFAPRASPADKRNAETGSPVQTGRPPTTVNENLVGSFAFGGSL